MGKNKAFARHVSAVIGHNGMRLRFNRENTSALLSSLIDLAQIVLIYAAIKRYRQLVGRKRVALRHAPPTNSPTSTQSLTALVGHVSTFCSS